jgi:hypothetical protein
MATQFNSKSGYSKGDKPAPAPAAKAAAPAKPASKPVKGPGRYEPSQEEIGIRAFEIYVSEGCQEGSDLDNWLRAEKELRSQGPR